MTQSPLKTAFKIPFFTRFIGKRMLKSLHFSLNEPIQTQANLLTQTIDSLKGTCIYHILNLDRVILDETTSELFDSFKVNVPLTTPRQLQYHIKISIRNKTHLFPSHESIAVAGMTSGTTGSPKIFPISIKGIKKYSSAQKTVFALPIMYGGISALRKKIFILRPAPSFHELGEIVDVENNSHKCSTRGENLKRLPAGYITSILGSYSTESKKVLPRIADIEIFPTTFDKIMIYYAAALLRYRKEFFLTVGITTLIQMLLEIIQTRKEEVFRAINVLYNRDLLLEIMKREYTTKQIESMYLNKDLLAESLEQLYVKYKTKYGLISFYKKDPELEYGLSKETLIGIFPSLKAQVLGGVPFDRSIEKYFVQKLGKKVLNINGLGGADSAIGSQMASKLNGKWILDESLTPLVDYSLLEFLPLETLYKNLETENTELGIDQDQLVDVFTRSNNETKFIWELEPETQYLLLSTVPYWPLVRYCAGDVVKTTSEKIGESIFKLKFNKRIEGGFNYFGSKVSDSELVSALGDAALSTGTEVIHFTIAPVFNEKNTHIILNLYIEFVEPPKDIIEFESKFKAFLMENNNIFARIHDRFIIKTRLVKKNGFALWTAKKGTRFPGHTKIPIITEDSSLLNEFLIPPKK